MAEERSSLSYDLSFQFSSFNSSSTNIIELRSHTCLLTVWYPHSYTRSFRQIAASRLSITISISSTTHSISYSSKLNEYTPQAYRKSAITNSAHCTTIINASSSPDYPHSITIRRHWIHHRIHTDIMLHRFTRNENWDNEQTLVIHFTLCTMSISSKNAGYVRNTTHLHELQLHSLRATILRFHAVTPHGMRYNSGNRGHV